MKMSKVGQFSWYVKFSALIFLAVLSAIFTRFAVEFSNWSSFFQQFSWILVLALLPIYTLRAGSKIVLWLTSISSVFGIASVVLRAQDWLRFCLDCNHVMWGKENKFFSVAIETQLRGYFEFVSFLIWIALFAAVIILWEKKSPGRTPFALLSLLIAQGTLFLFELSASAFWFGSELTKVLGPVYWQANIREASAIVFIATAIYLKVTIIRTPKAIDL